MEDIHTLEQQLEQLAIRNTKLEKALAASRAREAALWKKIEVMKAEQKKLEEAEERLCSQLGQLEAEYMQQSRQYRLQMEDTTKIHQQEISMLTQTLEEKNAEIKSLVTRLQEVEPSAASQSAQRDYSVKISTKNTQESSDYVELPSKGFVLSIHQGLDKIFVWNKPVESVA